MEELEERREWLGARGLVAVLMFLGMYKLQFKL